MNYVKQSINLNQITSLMNEIKNYQRGSYFLIARRNQIHFLFKRKIKKKKKSILFQQNCCWDNKINAYSNCMIILNTKCILLLKIQIEHQLAMILFRFLICIKGFEDLLGFDLWSSNFYEIKTTRKLRKLVKIPFRLNMIMLSLTLIN